MSDSSGVSKHLIPRSPPQAGASKDEARTSASWFETAHSRLLTMRVERYSRESGFEPRGLESLAWNGTRETRE